MIFAARQFQENCCEQHRDLYIMAWIDLTKAFDTVHWPTLRKVLRKIERPQKLVNGDYTNEFDLKLGVKQCCVLAPTLFAIFLTSVLQLVRKNAYWDQT